MGDPPASDRFAILAAIHVVTEPAIAPGVCEWRVEGAGTFWSACNTVDRTAKEVARIAAKTIASKPWTVANPDGYPAIYIAVASAFLDGRRVELVVRGSATP